MMDTSVSSADFSPALPGENSRERTEGEDMADTIHCEECSGTWAAEHLAPVHDYWSRVDPGGVVPIGQCPNTECGALCYPSYGFHHRTLFLY